MASLFRKTVTRPLPNGATIERRKAGPVAIWHDRNGRKQAAPLVLDADGELRIGADGKPRIRTTSATVYAKVAGLGDAIATGCKTEDGARFRLSEMVKRAEHRRANILTAAEAQTADHQHTPLSGHIDAYGAHLTAKGVTETHRTTQLARLTRLAAECPFAKLRDLDRATLEKWLVKQAHEDMSARTRNAFIGVAVTFANWCLESHRLTANPFVGIGRADEKADPRRKRRAMTEEELGRLLKVARLRPLAEFGRETLPRDDREPDSPKSRATWKRAPLAFITLDAAVGRAREALKENPTYITELERRGAERALVYKCLILTGLRRGELASLTIGQCDLTGAAPHVTLNAADEKNREGNTLPLRGDLAADLAGHLSQRVRDAQRAAKAEGQAIPLALPAGERLIYVPRGLVRILDRDLKAAGIPKRDDRGRTLDVHALRHTFGTLLSRAGVSLRTAQAAMRHADPSMTANVYTDPRLLDVTGAIESLPALPLGDTPDRREAATGTCDAKGDENGWSLVAPTVAPTAGNRWEKLASAGHGDQRNNETARSYRANVSAENDAGWRSSARDGSDEHRNQENGRYRTRTCDILRVKQALYQLS